MATLHKTSSINTFEKLMSSDTMQSLIDQGKQHMENLFNYKSVISGLIQVKGESENKKELYKKNLEMLDPQVQKMRDLSSYYDMIVNATVGYMQNVIKNEQPPTEEQQKVLVQILDVFVVLDYLKTWQAGLNNDFSMYRRAIQHVKKDYNMSEDETLRFFLINTNNINKGLKKNLQDKVKGYEKVLVFLIKYCADEFEKDDKQSQFLRIAVFCVYLIDQIFADNEQVMAIKKHVKLQKTCKMFSEYPKITLYKSLPFNVSNYLKNAPNWSDKAEQFAVAQGNCPLL